MAGQNRQGPFSRRSDTRQSVPPAGKKKSTLSPEQQHAKDLLRRPLQDLEDRLSNSSGDNSKQFTQWAIKAADDSYPGICQYAWAVSYFFVSKRQINPYKPGKSDVDQSTASGAQGGAAASCASPAESKKGGKEVKRLDPHMSFVTNKEQESAQRGDTPHRILGRAFRILNNRLELEGKGPTMFIISQFEYMHLLSWIRKPHMSKKYFEKQFPKVFDDPEKYIDYKKLEKACKDRGEIDLMILHEEKGILLIQIKSVKRETEVKAGSNKSMTKTEKDYIEDKLEKAYKQLLKDVTILNQVMERSQHWVQGKDKITKVIAVPNLSQDDLELLDLKRYVKEKIVFLCKDHMMVEGPQCIEQPESEANIDGLLNFWTTSLPENVSLSEECIKEIVGLYVGPLSAVFEPVDDKPCEKPWSFKQCVWHAGFLFSSLILTDTQRAIVEKRTKGQRRVYISGPPGSGKTLCLMLKASSYIAESSQHQVILLNMYPGADGRAIGQKTFTIIRQNVPDKNRVHQLDLNLHNDKFVDRVKGLLQKATPEDWKSMLPHVLFIVDEVYIESFWEEILDAFREELVDNKKGELADCEVWCAGLFSVNPKGFIEHSLDFVLRCPPAVQQLLYHVDWDQERKKKYRRDTEWLEVLSNGPVPLCIRHKFHKHSNVRVIDCAQCATQLSEVVKKELTEKTQRELTEETRRKRPVSSPLQSGSSTQMPSSRSELTMVILINIPRNMYHEDDEDDKYITITIDDYNKYMKEVENSPFVKTLRQQNITVVLKEKLASHELGNVGVSDSVGNVGVSDSAVMATWLYNFQGLEADVVIYLPGDPTSDSQPCSQRRDIPAPGVKRPQSDPDCRTAESSTESTETPPDSSSAGGDGARVSQGGGEATGSSQGPPERESLARLMWRKDDIKRYSDWDMTNILIAGSRSVSLVILMVP